MTDGDSRGELYDLSDRIRTLNEEMAKEPPLPEERTTQASVKFKDTLVDFISPTPEPEPDSEEEPGTDPSTPRSDEDVEQQPRDSETSDPDFNYSDVDGSSKDATPAAELDEQDGMFVADDGLQSPSDFLPEDPPFESDWSLNSPECEATFDGKKSPSDKNTEEVNAESSLADTNSPVPYLETVEPDAETNTDEACRSPDDRVKEKSRTSKHNQAAAVCNTMLATKVVTSFGKSTGKNSKPKSLKAGNSLPDAENIPKNTDKTPGIDEVVETDEEVVDEICSSTKPSEKNSSNRSLAARNAIMAAKVVSSFGKPRNRRPKSAEAKSVGRSRNVDSQSEPDDMALVECSGKFRMMSIAELTTLQRRSAPNGGSFTARTPATTTWTQNSRLTVLSA